MKEPKRYYCGNGEGMFEDNKNGDWVAYSKHKTIVEALIEQLRKYNDSHCDCTQDETTGTTTVRCCNICGKPAESFWRCG